MKELYTAPEANIVSFAAAQAVAVDPLDLTVGGDIHTSVENEGGGSDF